MPFYNVFLLYFFLNLIYFVKHFELPCAERCYINKLALPKILTNQLHLPKIPDQFLFLFLIQYALMISSASEVHDQDHGVNNKLILIRITIFVI